MAIVTPSKIDATRGISLMMHSVATHKYEGVFDSYLKLHNSGSDNHTLTLILKSI